MPNINDLTRLYRRTVLKPGDSSATVKINLDPVDPNTLRVLTHVTVENETSAYTKLRIGINERGRDKYLDELSAPAADELAVSRSNILLGEGDVFFAELTGTTDADSLIMTAIGWEQDL